MDNELWLAELAQRDAEIREDLAFDPAANFRDLTLTELQARVLAADAAIKLRDEIISSQAEVIGRLTEDNASLSATWRNFSQKVTPRRLAAAAAHRGRRYSGAVLRRLGKR